MGLRPEANIPNERFPDSCIWNGASEYGASGEGVHLKTRIEVVAERG
jgi:hypothetical protein